MKRYVLQFVALVMVVAACGDSTDSQSTETVPATSGTAAVEAIESDTTSTLVVEGNETSAAHEPVADEPVADDGHDSDANAEEMEEDLVETLAELWDVDTESIECLIEESGSLAAGDLSAETVSAETVELLAICGMDYEQLLEDGAFEDPQDIPDAGDTEVDELVIEAIADALGTEPENVVCLMEQLDLSDPQALADELDTSEVLLMMIRCDIDVSNLAES